MTFTAKQQSAFEIVLVLGVMLAVKDIADRFNLIGAGSVAMWCGILVATFFMRRKNISWRSRGLALPTGDKRWLKTAGLVVFIIATSIAFMAGLLSIISELLGVAIPESSTDRFEFFLGKPLFFISYLLVVIWIGAALGEELLMRGFLLNQLIDIFGDHKKGLTAAIILHAMIFGMLHISQGIPGVIGTGFVAIILGAVYLYNKRNLFPLIIAHGLINTIGLIGYYVSDGQLT